MKAIADDLADYNFKHIHKMNQARFAFLSTSNTLLMNQRERECYAKKILFHYRLQTTIKQAFTRLFINDVTRIIKI